MFYGIPEKTVKDTMKMYNSIQPFAPSPNGDTEYFNIKDCVKQSGKRRYLAENIVDTYYTDDLAVLWQNRRCRDPTAQN